MSDSLATKWHNKGNTTSYFSVSAILFTSILATAE